MTLFVVGHYAARIRSTLAEFAAAGHEIASHGPDHGRLPAEGIVNWLRQGREMLEDLLGIPVTGFRSPRFDVPAGIGLERYREHLAEAGYDYVSDASYLGPASALRELPVLSWRGVHVGGGSYQRLLPTVAVTRAVARHRGRPCSTTTPTTSTAPSRGCATCAPPHWPSRCSAGGGSPPSSKT